MNQKTAREVLIEAGVDAAELAQVRVHNGLDIHTSGSEREYWYVTDVTPSGILIGAFVWEDTPQGHDYWYVVYCTLLEKERLEGVQCE